MRMKLKMVDFVLHVRIKCSRKCNVKLTPVYCSLSEQALHHVPCLELTSVLLCGTEGMQKCPEGDICIGIYLKIGSTHSVYLILPKLQSTLWSSTDGLLPIHITNEDVACIIHYVVSLSDSSHLFSFAKMFSNTSLKKQIKSIDSTCVSHSLQFDVMKIFLGSTG